MNKLIILTITAVFFPIYVQFHGRDAITTGSIAIVLSFSIYIISGLITRHITFRLGVMLFTLTMIGFISQFSASPELWSQSFRHFVAFVSSLMLFFIVINYYSQISEYNRFDAINKLILFVLILCAVQIVIGIILYFYPPFGKALSIFTTRTDDILTTPFAGAKRLQSIMTGWEEFGEFIAVLAPFLFYFIIKSGGKIYSLFLLMLFIAGAILTATRSAIILFVFAGFVFLIWNRHFIRINKLLISAYIFGIFILILVYIFPTAVDVWDAAIVRFDVFSETYAKTKSIVAAIDRQGTWDYAKMVVWPNLNLFGNSLVTPGNFHNLYLTLIYQFGVIGITAFLSFFVYISIRLLISVKMTVDPIMKCLASACILSFAVFLVNEIKFEFNRGSSYQQIIWFIFSIYWLVSQLVKMYIQTISKEKLKRNI